MEGGKEYVPEGTNENLHIGPRILYLVQRFSYSRDKKDTLFSTEHLKNHTLSRGTYIYSLHMEIPPPPPPPSHSHPGFLDTSRSMSAQEFKSFFPHCTEKPVRYLL